MALQPVVPGQITWHPTPQARSQLALPSQTKMMSSSSAPMRQLDPPVQVQLRVSASQLHVPLHSSTPPPPPQPVRTGPTNATNSSTSTAEIGREQRVTSI